MPRVKANSVNLEYVDRGDGPVLILIHGSLSDYRAWNPQIEAFAREFRVISYSRRCHYPNEWADYPEEYSLLTERDDLLGLIENLHLDTPLNLFGSSYGGSIATTIAQHNPQIVSSLVLAEPPILSLLANTDYSQLYLEFRGIIAKVVSMIDDGNHEGAARFFVDTMMGKGAFEKNASRKTMILQNVWTLSAELKTLPRRHHFECADAKKILAPTLLLNAEHSPEFFRRIIDTMERCIPNSSRILIGKASHGMGENATHLNREVLNFLKRNA